MSDDDFEYQETAKDRLEGFFASPSKDNLPDILRTDKEYDYLDFKREWHERSQLAKHILAFSNSGGGAIVIGVEEEEDGALESIGLEDSIDESDFGNLVEKYIPDAAHGLYRLETFIYGEVYDERVSGLKFQVLFIENAGKLAPLVATSEGTNIEEGAIYLRRNTKSTIANYDEVQSLLRKRHERGLEKETAELHEELRQLRTLYDEIDKNKKYSIISPSISDILESSFYETKPNPHYPEIEYEAYISNLIKKKKRRIEKRLGVENINL